MAIRPSTLPNLPPLSGEPQGSPRRDDHLVTRSNRHLNLNATADKRQWSSLFLPKSRRIGDLRPLGDPGESPSGMRTHVDITLGSDSRADETRTPCRSFTRADPTPAHSRHFCRARRANSFMASTRIGSVKWLCGPIVPPFRAIFGQGYNRAAVDAWSRRPSAAASGTPCAPSRAANAKA